MIKPFLAFLTACVVAGCASEPMIQKGPGAEVSFDGLHRVDNAQMAYTWLRPGIDLSGYDQIKLVGAGIEYRRTKTTTSGGPLGFGESNFPLNNDQKARLKKQIEEVFLVELSKSKHFTLTDKNGPNVLELKGSLLDVASSIPPDSTGRATHYLSKIGEASLVLELRDSQSSQILARAIDIQTIKPAIGAPSTPIANRMNVQREFRQWAVLLTKRLDELHQAAAIGN